MNETHRTIILILLLVATAAFIWWVRTNYQVNFEDTL